MSKAVEIIKLALTALLLVSLVCLSVFYMNLYGSVKTYDFTAENDKAVRNRFYKSSYVGLMDEGFVSPYFVGICVDGAKTGYLGTRVDTIYASLKNSVSEFLSASAQVAVSSAEEFASCADGDFIYIRYRCELPRSVIYYMQNSDKILDDVDDEYIYDMFILPYERGTYAVARDKRGNYYRYTSSGAPAINKNMMTSYTYFEEAFPFSFTRDMMSDGAFADFGYGEKLDEYEILTSGGFYAASAVVDVEDILQKERVPEMLTALGINPERATSHESEDGVTYFDEGENVFTDRYGRLLYTAFSAQSGIPLSDIIGYAASDDGYSLTDLVGAALVLGNSLGAFDGGAFSYAVTAVEPSAAGIVIEISHIYDGISVDFDGDRALKIKVEDGHVTYVFCKYADATPYDGQSTVENAPWLLRAAVAESEGKFGLTYIQKMQNGRLHLVLAAVTSGEASDE